MKLLFLALIIVLVILYILSVLITLYAEMYEYDQEKLKLFNGSLNRENTKSNILVNKKLQEIKKGDLL